MWCPRISFLTRVFIGIMLTCRITRSEVNNRESRLIYYNPSAPTLVGLLLSIPFSLALPAVVRDIKFGRRGRSVDSAEDSTQDDVDLESDYYWEPAYKQQLAMVSTYFSLLEVSSLTCQERFICELSSEQENFSPVSDMFASEIRPKHGPIKPSNDSLMWRYISASYKGFTSSIEDCSRVYPGCSSEAAEILNMPFLKLWQFIGRLLNVKIFNPR